MIGASGLQWWRVHHSTEQWLAAGAVIRLRVDALTSTTWSITAVVFGSPNTSAVTVDVRLSGDYASEADANAAVRNLLLGQVPADWLS